MEEIDWKLVLDALLSAPTPPTLTPASKTRAAAQLQNPYAVGKNGATDNPNVSGIGKIHSRPKNFTGTKLYLWRERNQ